MRFFSGRNQRERTRNTGFIIRDKGISGKKFGVIGTFLREKINSTYSEENI